MAAAHGMAGVRGGGLLVLFALIAVGAANEANEANTTNETDATGAAASSSGAPPEGTSPYQPYAPPARFCYTCGSQMSAGYYHTCGIERNGTMLCWGSNDENQSRVPSQYVRFQAIPKPGLTWEVLGSDAPQIGTEIISASLAAALEKKLEFSRQELGWFRLPDLRLDSYIRVGDQYLRPRKDSTTNHTWSILYDYHREVRAVDPDTGEMRLMLFNFSDPDLAFTVPEFTWIDISGWKAVACGYTHTCGITLEHALLCWGQGKNQQALLPQWIMASPQKKWRQVSTGAGHSCAIAMDGSAACWGANDEGQTNLPAGVSNWTSISCGYAHTCGVAGDGSAHCWGWNGVTPGGIVPYGQCQVPDAHYNNNTWRDLSAGFVHSCGVDSLGAGHCWGDGTNGQLLVPQVFETAESQSEILTPYHHAPTRVPARWKSIQASYFHTCGLTINGSVFCWGNNDAEQLNVPAATDGRVRFLSSGFAHNCVIQDTGDCRSVPPHLIASILMNFPRHLDALINSIVDVFPALSIIFFLYFQIFCDCQPRAETQRRDVACHSFLSPHFQHTDLLTWLADKFSSILLPYLTFFSSRKSQIDIVTGISANAVTDSMTDRVSAK